MSIPSSMFRIKNSNTQADLDELKEQNRMLFQQNLNLKKSLEELISINTELTQSIEEFNNSHIENFPHVNQQEIEELALKVIDLEQELERERVGRQQEQQQNTNDHNNNTVEETLKVIEELVASVNEMQQEYQQQLERMEVELQDQRNQWLMMSEAVENKLVKFEGEYSKLMAELRQSEGLIKKLEGDLQQKGKNQGMSRKQMKISTTIEDLRVTLQKQIEEKDRIIRLYERTLDQVKSRLSEKIST